MKINTNTKVEGLNAVLVPYREQHVVKYHEWMTDPELLILTASEPLTIEEEFEMQKTWQRDENKLTFIILNKSIYNSIAGNYCEREVKSMVGDVNAFLSSENDDNVLDIFEIDVMISEKEYRSQGFGSEAVYLMMYYCLKNFPDLKEFIVKINDDNEASIKMFMKMGFQNFNYLTAFKQVCLKFVIDREIFKNNNDQTIQNSLKVIEKFSNTNIHIDLNYG